jgi:hypothetical protein
VCFPSFRLAFDVPSVRWLRNESWQLSKKVPKMAMFLMILAFSLLGVALSALAFMAATRVEAPLPEIRQAAPAPEVREPAVATQSFWVAGAAAPRLPAVPIEALLLQIEQHVRLETAAAESFLHAPTRESLHSRTSSTLVH